MDPTEIADLVQLIDQAHLGNRLLRCAEVAGRLGIEDAYRVQSGLTAWRLGRGDTQVGWKLGYTSAVMRRQMNVSAPNHGPLLASMRLASGAEVPAHLVHPRVEPEILLELGRAVAPGATSTQLRGSVLRARVALEVVDSVWADYRFTLAANTADGSSAAAFVLGAELPPDTDHGAVEVELRVDGRPVGTGRADAAMGHPLAALAWLVQALTERGERLRAGDVVLTGGLTAAAPLPAGGTISGHFSVGGEVSVGRRVPLSESGGPPAPRVRQHRRGADTG